MIFRLRNTASTTPCWPRGGAWGCLRWAWTTWVPGVPRRWTLCLAEGKNCSFFNPYIPLFILETITKYSFSVLNIIHWIVRDILYIKTVHYVHSLCMTNKLWTAAVVYGEISLQGFRKYYGNFSSQLAALLVRSVSAFILIALKVFKLCPIVKTTHL